MGDPDARRRAEEALAFMDAALRDEMPPEPTQVKALADAVRALLASEPAKAPFVSRNEEWGLRPDFTTAGVTAPPAGAEPAKGACADCGGCGGLGWIPAGDEQLGCIDCNGKGTIEPAPPAGAEVREAAEVVRTILTAHDARLSESGALTYGPPSKGTGFVAAIQWLRRYDAARGGE